MAIQADSVGAPARGWRGFFVRSSGFSAPAVMVLAAIGLFLVILTTVVLNRPSPEPQIIFYVITADVAYFLVIFSLIAWRVISLIGLRRTRSAGAALHLRLTGIFTAVAMVPTIIVAVFAAISLTFGFETSFSERIRFVVNTSVASVEAYARERRNSIVGGALAFASDMERAGALGAPPEALTDILRRQQTARGFSEAYLINGARDILTRGEFSYTFTYDPPTESQIAAARVGDVVVFEDTENDEIRALVYVRSLIDTFLYVSRPIDGDVLLLLNQTADAVDEYNRLEASRQRLLTLFALIYLGFAVLVITAAVWVGLWFAERLSRPIGILAGAAERVGDGDLDVRVPEAATGDEVALLSRVFNRMTAQVKGQRDALIEANRDSERRRNFIETVLSGVSAGVVSLDAEGRIEAANQAALDMLGFDAVPDGGYLADIAPETQPVFERAAGSVVGAALSQVEVHTAGQTKELLIRVSARSSRDVGEGYVMTIDDLTALVSAQREAAWGDVARRIAHEIKNPLTPIQLSAERLKRKFGKIADADEAAAMDRYADVIVRQAADIRRMVDEFSRFARMPQPEAAPVDLAEIARDAVLLQSSAREDLTFDLSGADAPIMTHADKGMIHQALTNLIKNAAEAVDARLAETPEPPGRIRVTIRSGDVIEISVEDNGVGLPKSDRARLTEPYVTTREKGTGLGLAIVKKIAEQHRGALTLGDAEIFDEGAAPGAKVVMTLPGQGKIEV